MMIKMLTLVTMTNLATATVRDSEILEVLAAEAEEAYQEWLKIAKAGKVFTKHNYTLELPHDRCIKDTVYCDTEHPNGPRISWGSGKQFIKLVDIKFIIQGQWATEAWRPRKIKVGDRVRHEVHGDGEVKEIVGDDVTVTFETRDETVLVSTLSRKLPNHTLCFSVVSANLTLDLESQNVEEVMSWVKSLRKAASAKRSVRWVTQKFHFDRANAYRNKWHPEMADWRKQKNILNQRLMKKREREINDFFANSIRRKFKSSAHLNAQSDLLEETYSIPKEEEVRSDDLLIRAMHAVRHNRSSPEESETKTANDLASASVVDPEDTTSPGVPDIADPRSPRDRPNSFKIPEDHA